MELNPEITTASYQYIKTDLVGDKKNVGLITLDRPKALNALCNGLVADIADAVTKFNNDESVGAIIITGSEKVFAAGADLKEMLKLDFASHVKSNFLSKRTFLTDSKKPVIAAVNGYALGGGCELAMMCDIIYSGNQARFAQPEITVGTIPGAGGTQRLTRIVGKSKAMEMCLTGNQITAEEAEKMGLVSKVFPPEEVLPQAIKLAEKISSHSQIIVSLCKDAVNRAYETTLHEGLNYEARLFQTTFATEDRKEGMAAFAEKRAPKFKNQ
ncbi:probable enoyl-CoA hydratase, mitochondrial isoform X2 [Chrysoperla carnea]|uniref:probable enoyl-CoA hydratase, mitochondrial isoform X2 n=1 Tax=Chrysoperla carnea TaxID=189513 RepID=UPI001D071FDB|nr:probable enoyl-CoA hydratase, mitochondrial isoform X2 [Chrysoperla carnea]